MKDATKNLDELISLTEKKESLLPKSIIDDVSKIVKTKTGKKIKFKDGSAFVDLFSSSAIKTVYDALNPVNKKKADKMMSTKMGFQKFLNLALKYVK